MFLIFVLSAKMQKTQKFWFSHSLSKRLQDCKPNKPFTREPCLQHSREEGAPGTKQVTSGGLFYPDPQIYALF